MHKSSRAKRGAATSTAAPAMGAVRATPAPPLKKRACNTTSAQTPTPPSLTLSVQYQYNAAEARLPRWRLRRWAEYALQAAAQDAVVEYRHAAFNLRLTGLAEGRVLNRDFRGRDYATNVLTFEYGIDPEGTARGDIIICVPVLAREAREQKKPFLHHAAHLTLHGVLHALGYDHLTQRDARRMESLETRTLARMHIADPYTIV